MMGICSTDLELMRGYRDFRGILGHEFVGEVVTGPDEWLQKRVVGEINVVCHTCDLCRRGLHSHCRNRQVLGISGDYDGAFADVFRLPIENLHIVPDDLSNEVAVFAEPVAAACEILQQVHIQPHDRVVIIGVGKLGMLVAQVLKLTGAHITGLIRHDFQRTMLGKWGIAAQTADDLPAAQADVVVDCTGNPQGFSTALDLIRPRGTLVLKSTYEGLPEADLTRIAVDEIQVVGSRCGPFDVALRLIAEGRVDVQPMIESSYKLDQYEYAFEHAAHPGVLKVLFER
jgi:threonine dehydrogenase-like Zn-dependent dehydrogenase